MRTPKPDMTYNGTFLDWEGHGTFKATSGLRGHQTAAEQSHTDEGPIPEGLYSFPLLIAKDATMIGPGQLDRREGVEHLPDTFQYGGRTYQNQAWGPDRVRLTVVHIDDPRNRKRGGFYLHDSTKGYSHGCIEVDPLFFRRLREFVKMSPRRRGGRTRLYVKVKYPSPTGSTYGGTRVP
jgi:hypothetical protein